MSPSNKSDTKHAPPFGVTAIRHLKVLVCLYAEKVFPCLVKFLEHSTRNSVQSTMQRIFFIVLKTFGRNRLRSALLGNITDSMSLKILYMSWMYVVKIFLTCVCCILLSGELRSTARVLQVKPLFNLRRQMNSFSRVENSEFRPVFAFSEAEDSLQFQYFMVSKGQTSLRKLCKPQTGKV